VGGRLSVFGAVYGTLLVNWLKTSLSESFPELWLFGLGGIFIAIVMFFPFGLAGLYTSAKDRLFRKRAVEPSAGSESSPGKTPSTSTTATSGTTSTTGLDAKVSAT